MCEIKEAEIKPKIDQLIDAMNRLAAALEARPKPVQGDWRYLQGWHGWHTTS